MAGEPRERSKTSTGSFKFRIGLVADTHEAPDPLDLIRRLAQHECDYYVHLGDIGGSRRASNLVREYKQSLGSLENLSPEDLRRYEELRKQGLTPMWAYIESLLGSDQASRNRRVEETQRSYDSVVAAMSRLTRALFVSGNVDKSLMNNSVVRPTFDKHQASIIVEPHFLELGSTIAVLWPSIKPSDSHLVRRLDQTVESIVELAGKKTQVVILAHEQLFKGPSPRKYVANVEAAGYKPMTVPYYEPNPSWRHLLRLLRSLPADVASAFIYGHVHDPHHVIQAGAPYLKGSLKQGLEYRLYGLGNSSSHCGSSGRRTLRMFCVPANAVAVLTIQSSGIRFDISPE